MAKKLHIQELEEKTAPIFLNNLAFGLKIFPFNQDPDAILAPGWGFDSRYHLQSTNTFGPANTYYTVASMSEYVQGKAFAAGLYNDTHLPTLRYIYGPWL